MSCPVTQTARRSPSALALAFEEASWSYAELDRAISEWSARLWSRGVRPGDRVALLAANRPEGVFLLFAVRRLGATLVPLNARLTASELSGLLEQLNPAHRIASEALSDRLQDCWILEALAEEHPSELPTAVATSDVWAMLFTSGTTGRAKAVELTEGNLLASAQASGLNLGSDPEQRWLGNLPLFHVGGIAMAVRCAVYGCALELEAGFNLDRAIAALRSPNLTHVSLVPQTLARVVEAGPLRFSGSLRALLIGGGPSRPEVLAEARSRGLPVLQTYGLTEACSQVATERLAAADGLTSGRPLEGLSVRILGADGSVLGPGGEGEIQVRGATVMRGYFRNPEATARSLSGGWLHTGDLGALDEDGRLKVFARRSDLILSGGENIYPAELEQVLSGHPAVAEVAVVGAPDPRWGEVPVAVLVARADAAAAGGARPGQDLDGIEDWCRVRLAGFKVPRRWLWVEALPRNAGGKVDRAVLREWTTGAPDALRSSDELRRG